MIIRHPNSFSNIIYHTISVCLQICFYVDSKRNDTIEFMANAVPLRKKKVYRNEDIVHCLLEAGAVQNILCKLHYLFTILLILNMTVIIRGLLYYLVDSKNL